MITITMFAGDTLVIDYELKTAAGAPLDLTGATLVWAAAPFYAATPTLTRAVGSGLTLIDAAAGRLTVEIGRGVLVSEQTLRHELEVTLASGESYTLAVGVLKVRPALLRS